jgi:hypothetical protein
MRKIWIPVVVLSLACIAIALAQEQQPQAPAAAQPEATPAAATDTKAKTDAEKMMAEWMKYAMPGPQHEAMKKMEGKWDAEVSMQMAPDAPPDVSKGTMTNEMIFGGRYLKGSFEGTFMGKPFKGESLTAYDNYQKKYVNTWIDDMSTMVMVAEGSGDSSGNVITLNSTCPDPMSGEKKEMRTVMTIVDDDHHTYEGFQKGADGKEFKCLSIKYTRAK